MYPMILKIIRLIKVINSLMFRLKRQILLKRYSKQFTSFRETQDFCNSFTIGSYSNKNLNDFRLQRFKLNFENLHNIPQLSFKFLIKGISFYLNQFKQFPKILDLGGGYGDGFLYLRNIFKETDIDYTIIEQTNVVELSKTIDFKNKSNHNINFYDLIDFALKKMIMTFCLVQALYNLLKIPMKF